MQCVCLVFYVFATHAFFMMNGPCGSINIKITAKIQSNHLLVRHIKLQILIRMLTLPVNYFCTHENIFPWHKQRDYTQKRA